MSMCKRGLAACFAVILFAAWEVQGQPPAGGTPDRATRIVEDLERRIDLTVREAGVVESAKAVELRSEFPGEAVVLSVVPEGSQVKKGDLLAELDDSKLKESLRLQRIAVQKAEAGLAKAKDDMESAKLQAAAVIPAAKLKLRAAELARSRYVDEGGEFDSDLASATRNVEIAQQRHKNAESRLASAPNQDDARLAVAEAKSQLEQSQAVKQLLTRHVKGHQVALLELGVLEAQVALKQAESSILLETRMAESQVGVHQALRDSELARRDEIQQHLERCRILAPRDGVVMYAMSSGRRAANTNVEAGATVRQGQSLLSMPDLDRLQIRVRVHESRVSRVKSGQPVTLRLDAFPTRAFTGKVAAINGTPEPAQWLNQGGPEFGVIVTIDKPPEGIRLGMSTLAEIDTSAVKGP